MYNTLAAGRVKLLEKFEKESYNTLFASQGSKKRASIFFFIYHIYPPFTRAMYRYVLDGMSALAWELPFTGHLSST